MISTVPMFPHPGCLWPFPISLKGSWAIDPNFFPLIWWKCRQNHWATWHPQIRLRPWKIRLNRIRLPVSCVRSGEHFRLSRLFPFRPRSLPLQGVPISFIALFAGLEPGHALDWPRRRAVGKLPAAIEKFTLRRERDGLEPVMHGHHIVAEVTNCALMTDFLYV